MKLVKLVERRYNDVITDFSCHERETRETREIIRESRGTSSRETREKRVSENSLVKSSWNPTEIHVVF